MDLCAYCGDEIEDDGLEIDDQIFCSQGCVDVYNEERLEFLEEDDFD